MEHISGLFDRYDKILVFDTETTGLTPGKDEIIQFSGVLLEAPEGKPTVTQQYDELLLLPEGQTVPPEITKLTGISTQDVLERGISRERACREIGELISGRTLLAAYNAQFDLCFLFHMMAHHGDPGLLQGKDKLDLLTVYRDRRSYPHRLFNAIEAYGLSGKVQNSHSADEDALATVYVMDAMAAERDDLLRYIDLFGYFAKYGVPRPRIRSVSYKPQGYEPTIPLYEKP